MNLKIFLKNVLKYQYNEDILNINNQTIEFTAEAKNGKIAIYIAPNEDLNEQTLSLIKSTLSQFDVAIVGISSILLQVNNNNNYEEEQTAQNELYKNMLSGD